MKFAIATVRRDHHSTCFGEVAETLFHGLRALGRDAIVLEPNEFASDRCNIVLGSNLLPHVSRVEPPRGSILYNLEQAGSPWMRSLPDVLRPYKVWDYDAASTAFLCAQGIDARLVPIGYVPELTRIRRAPEQDIDVLFYGSVNARRRRALDALARRGLDVVEVFACYGQRRDDLIARSKVVLNVHYYEPGIFEVVRVSYLLANRVCVVCEEGEGAEPFREGVALGPYDDLPAICASAVRDDTARLAMAERGFAIMRARPETEFLAEALEELGGDSTGRRATTVESGARQAKVRISLCLIARNEASNLEGCLEPLGGLVDEIVVVDTGSTDATREIALRRGARVFDFPWCDDFSAARNESIRHATGDWIFWLDADEWLDELNRERLRALLSTVSDENAAYTMRCVGFSAENTEADSARLFRNDPRVRWRFRVHEQIVGSVRQAGGYTRATDVVIHKARHDATVRRNKLERNLRLLDLDLDQLGFNAFTLFHRGSTLLDLDRPAEALVALHLCHGCATKDADIARRLHVTLARAYMREHRVADALEALCAGRALYPDDMDLSSLNVQFLASLAEYAEAPQAVADVLVRSPH